jgi:hypothetical protein
MPATYHTQVRLACGRESLLLDIGAIGNLAGSNWTDRNVQIAANAGQGSHFTKLQKAIGIEGVGSGESTAEQEVMLPICLPDGRQGFFRTPVVANSELPALWGLNSLRSLHAIVDTHNNQLILPGPGGYKLSLSPGSTVYKTLHAKSGHMMLPCQEWKEAKPGMKKPGLSL